MELWMPPASKTGITSAENGFLDAMYYYQAQMDQLDDADEKQLLYFAAANSLNSVIPRGASIDAQTERATLHVPDYENAYVNLPDVGVAGTLDDIVMTMPRELDKEYSDSERALHYQLMLAVQVEGIYSLTKDAEDGEQNRDMISTKARIPIVAAKLIMLDTNRS